MRFMEVDIRIEIDILKVPSFSRRGFRGGSKQAGI